MKIQRFLPAIILCALHAAGVSAAAAGETADGPRPAAPRGRTVGSYQRESVRRLLAGAPRSVDSLRVCVFRVSFTDRDFKAQFDSIYFANELRHLAEYYDGASRGIFDLRCELMSGVVRLYSPEGYYGRSDLWKERMAEILIQVVLERDDEVDFSRYDAVAVIHAGAGRETDFNNDSPEQIYSGFVNPDEMAEALKDTLGTPGVPTNDGAPGDTLYLDNLMVWPEEGSQDGFVFGSLGVYAYQVGLRIGMIPLFDTTPGDFPDSQGCGNFDLMGYGIYNALGFIPAFPSAFNRYLMGWATPTVVSDDAELRLADVSTAADADTGLVKILINPSEYYLLENRVHDTNFNGVFDFIDLNGNGIPENEDTLRGAEFDFFLTATSNLRPEPDSIVTGSGLMIWHVDETVIRAAIDGGSYPNDEPRMKGVDLEEADGIQDLDRPGGGYSFGSHFDSFRRRSNDRFAADTDPSSRTNGGAASGVAVENISDPGPYMRFSVHFTSAMPFVRAEFAADLSRYPPVAAQRPDVIGLEMLVMAADSGRIYLSPGSAEWAPERIVNESSRRWISSPVVADIGSPPRSCIFLVSVGGVLCAYETSGDPVPVDNDATPLELALPGNSRASLLAAEIDGDSYDEIVAVSSTDDSTYVTVLGYGGPEPVGDWSVRGPGAYATALASGRLASRSALGLSDEASPSDGGGIFFATFLEGEGLRFHFASLWTRAGLEYGPAFISTAAAGVEAEPSELLTPCSGDLDRNGSDEMVAAVPDCGLFYFSAEGDLRRRALRGSRPSAPIFCDLDGDGILETALRDEGHLYCFSGFGVPVTGWPVAIDATVSEAYASVAPAAPVAGDLDGNGKADLLFRVGGAIHAYEPSGRALPGWPVPGEGPSGGGLALLRNGGDLYIMDCATVAPAGADGSALGPVSSIRSYAPGTDYSDEQAWPCHRHDGRGSARQRGSEGGAGSDRAVFEGSFIVYPNPVRRQSFAARIIISKPARVSVAIYNLEGEQVAKRERRHDWPPGSAVPFEETFAAGDFASGVYLCRVEITGDGWSWKGTKKFAVVR